jgi:hypothetical protein
VLRVREKLPVQFVDNHLRQCLRVKRGQRIRAPLPSHHISQRIENFTREAHRLE